MELAKYVLSQESTGPFGMCDSLMQRWAGGPGDSNSALAEIPLENFKLGNGTISLKITDLDRKFNINLADEVILRQGLTLIGVDAAEFPTIVDSIMDWRDPLDDQRPNGTESSTYRNAEIPYVAKDGPLDDLSELLLIRGITAAMYWGSSGGGAATQVMNRQRYARRDGFEEPAYVVGFVDLFTTVSGRLININTASATQLQIIPEIDENVAQAIVTARAGPDGAEGTLDDMPFRSPAELARVPGMNPMITQQLGRYFTVRSLVFEVRVTAQIDNEKREFVGLLRRNNPRDIQLLSFYWQ
jgi:type II secretory pathway component PulK